MQSLDNAMDDVEVVAWVNRVRKLLSSISNTSDAYVEDGKAGVESNIAQKNPIKSMLN